jgi:hypothetical protein
MKPTLLINRLSSLLLILVIPGEHTSTTREKLSARPRLISREVIELWAIFQTELKTRLRRADTADVLVKGEGARAETSVLRLPVSFTQIDAEGDTEKLDHLAADGRRARHHRLDVAAEKGLHLFEDKAIPECVRDAAVNVVVRHLGLDCATKQLGCV